MPWSPDDAERHTKKARRGKAKRQWAHVANAELKRSGDEGRAVRIANGVVKRRGGNMAKRKKHGRKKGRY